MPCSTASLCSCAWRAVTSAIASLTACDVAGRVAGAVRARESFGGGGEPPRPELMPACSLSAPARLAGRAGAGGGDGAALSGCSRVLDSAGRIATGRRTLAAIPPSSSAIPAQSPPLAPPRRRPIRSGSGMLSSTTTIAPGRAGSRVPVFATTCARRCARRNCELWGQYLATPNCGRLSRLRVLYIHAT